MANEPEQIEIEVDEVEQKKDDEVKVVKAENDPGEVSKSESEDIDALKQRLERETTARIAAERRAYDAQHVANSAKSEVQDTNITLISQAMDNLKQNNAVLKSNLAVAMQNGDYELAAEIQTNLSENSAKLLHLDQGKSALETQRQQPQQQPAFESDPVERLASQLTHRSAEWVRRNPEFARDPSKYQKMIAAHNMVMADGVRADTDEYFSEIESLLRIKRQDDSHEDPTMSAAKPTQSRSSPPAAPVSRAGTPNGTRPNVVRLTSAEREMAQMMGMTDSEYAKNKLALQREGKLS